MITPPMGVPGQAIGLYGTDVFTQNKNLHLWLLVFSMFTCSLQCLPSPVLVDCELIQIPIMSPNSQGNKWRPDKEVDP